MWSSATLSHSCNGSIRRIFVFLLDDIWRYIMRAVPEGGLMRLRISLRKLRTFGYFLLSSIVNYAHERYGFGRKSSSMHSPDLQDFSKSSPPTRGEVRVHQNPWFRTEALLRRSDVEETSPDQTESICSRSKRWNIFQNCRVEFSRKLKHQNSLCKTRRNGWLVDWIWIYSV